MITLNVNNEVVIHYNQNLYTCFMKEYVKRKKKLMCFEAPTTHE